MTLDLDLIKSWIDDCTRNHGKCASHSSVPWYPTRLLDITSGRLLTGVKLVITKDIPIKGPYITLSHRWAPHAHRFPMLRSSTISQFQEGINVRRLPRAFQDAIDLSRQLEVNYLWIDSLCIIQDEDDQSDWDRECFTMDKVYSHAFLNISATLSQSGTESLFQQCHSQAPSLPTRIDLSAHGNIKKQYIVNSNFWHDEISEGPLNNRGWVFQERFLACRVLHFGQRQIGWECQVSEAIGAFPGGLPHSLSVGSRSKPGNREALSKASQEAQSQAQIVQNGLLVSFVTDIRFTEWWNSVIKDYSRCKFTFTKDKLIALSGVAKYVAKSRPMDRYLAGMWQSCMVYGLAWFRIHDPGRIYSNTGSFDFHAPSWSWASFDGEVCFPTITPGNPALFAKVVHIAEDPMFPEGTVYANAAISPHAYASIKIETFLFPLHVDWSASSIDSIMIVDFGLCFSEKDDDFGTRIDVEGDEMLKGITSRYPLFLAPLYATTYFLQAMILLSAEGQSNAYYRLGGVEIPIRNEESDTIHLNQNALDLIQHMGRHSKGVARTSRYSAFEII